MPPINSAKKKAVRPVKEVSASKPYPQKRVVAVVCAMLVLACVAIFGQTVWHGFIVYDDERFVANNPHVQAGLSWATVAWAFTNHVEDYPMPLSWLSHALDCQLFGMWGGGHHLMNLILHALNAVLLFWLMLRLTGARGPSAMVAALFAVHPLHVESVAWASERKDVLSALFWCLTLLAYTHYAAKPMVRRYLLVTVLYVLALLSKPMVMTLPCLLLLLDYWPLRRIHFEPFNRAAVTTGARLVLEKVPLFALAAVDGAATFLLQRLSPHTVLLEDKSLVLRLSNAVVSYAFFVVKSVLPTGLSVFYAWPAEGFALWQVAGSAALLIFITAAALMMAKKRPYLIVGWLWYLGLMAPTMQVLQRYTFPYARADRYTYCSLIGITIMVVWGVADLAAARHVPRRALAVASAVVLVLLTVCAGVQASHWQSSETLARHEIAIGRERSLAFNILGELAVDEGRYDDAKALLTKALDLEPTLVDAIYNMGYLALIQKHYDEANTYLTKALKLDPTSVSVLNSLGACLICQGKCEEAQSHLRKALEIEPEYISALENMSAALAQLGRKEEADSYFKKAAALRQERKSKEE